MSIKRNGKTLQVIWVGDNSKIIRALYISKLSGIEKSSGNATAGSIFERLGNSPARQKRKYLARDLKAEMSESDSDTEVMIETNHTKEEPHASHHRQKSAKNSRTKNKPGRDDRRSPAPDPSIRLKEKGSTDRERKIEERTRIAHEQLTKNKNRYQEVP